MRLAEKRRRPADDLLSALVAVRDGGDRCLGAPLARPEGRIAFGSLITWFPRLRLAVPVAEIVRTRGSLMNGSPNSL